MLSQECLLVLFVFKNKCLSKIRCRNHLQEPWPNGERIPLMIRWVRVRLLLCQCMYMQTSLCLNYAAVVYLSEAAMLCYSTTEHICSCGIDCSSRPSQSRSTLFKIVVHMCCRNPSLCRMHWLRPAHNSEQIRSFPSGDYMQWNRNNTFTHGQLSVFQN